MPHTIRVKHFEVLVDNRKKLKAVELFPELMSSTATRAPSAERVLTVTNWLKDFNKHKGALGAYAYFLKHYKGHRLAPNAYFELAKLLHEKADNSKKARQILQGIIRTFPEHPLTHEATRYLALVS